MQHYIVELSKYLITVLMAFYTLEGFLVFQIKREKTKKGCLIRQRVYLFLIQFLAFATMAFKSGDSDYWFFYVFVQVFFFAVLSLTGLIYEKANRLLINNMCMLLGIGFIVLARLSMHKLAIRQLAIVIISYVLCMVIPWLFARLVAHWKKLTWAYAGVGFVALFAVFILGDLTYGSKISFSIANLTFQPSEFVKIIFVFFLAAALWQDSSFKRVAITAVVAGAHVIVLVLSKDLGSALVFFIAYVLVVFMATDKYRYLILGFVGLAVCSVVAYFLFRHVRVRVLAWQDPFSYIDGMGYQITQSLFAISTGSWFGMGLLGGTPGDIPFVETDFVFSAVCEEMGLVTGICVLLICVCNFLTMLQIGTKCKDKFYRLLAQGFGIIYIFQIFLTVGGGTKFIPLTGITLPFISYGGSSIMTSMLLFFFVEAVAMTVPKRSVSARVQRGKEGEPRYVVSDKEQGKEQTDRRKSGKTVKTADGEKKDV